ncbi:MAG: cyclic nucleotide-binding domain-containing protein [Deltaproteobacteria bacterium]|jgi:CRP-like cAMP-binding protein|nr:cyclic nucleotide-binding domain-containing protein [Deltaproteobacteria bacterium]
MYVKQSELFMGTSMDFVKKFMDISQMTSHAKGEILFRENDPARYFYILLSGCVKLSVGKPGQVVYEACGVGEAFGWSSLIGGDEYSASAECVEPTKLLKTDNEKFKRVLDQDPFNGVIFFKQLASTLGHRLLESYKIISPRS